LRLLEEVQRINSYQQDNVVNYLRDYFDEMQGKRIGLLGLSFKPKTYDMRNSPSIRIANLLYEDGVIIKAYDPVAMENAKKLIPFVELCENPYQVAENVDALILITEWDIFCNLDMKRIKSLMKGNLIFDGRNIWDRNILEGIGFIYKGIGK